MNVEDFCDLALTEDGDIIVQSGDLMLRYGLDAIADQVLFRLKTVIGDYPLEPGCGANLESLVGEPNTAETGRKAEGLVIRALTHDGFLNPLALEVEAVPTSETEITTVVSLPSEHSGVLIAASVDLKEGEVVVSR